MLSKQYDSKTHFISDQTYTDTTLARHSLILNMLIFSKYYSDVLFCPSFFGSDECEVLFSFLGGFTSVKTTSIFLKCSKWRKLLNLKYKGRRLKSKRNHSAWPTNLGKEIIEGLKDAGREVLKTVEEIRMVPGLREANIVYKNPKTGELTCLNTATEAYISEKHLFPDELSVVSVDELFDLENEILLDNTISTDVAEIDGVTGIIADEMQSEQLEIILDEGDPRNCQL